MINPNNPSSPTTGLADALINELNKPSRAYNNEDLKDAFNAGYDYRSSKDPNIIKEFGENSADGFEAFYKNKTESK